LPSEEAAYVSASFFLLSAVNAICCTYDSLVATLEEILEGIGIVTAVEATGFLFQMRTFKFLIMLVTTATGNVSCRRSDHMRSISVSGAWVLYPFRSTRLKLYE